MDKISIIERLIREYSISLKEALILLDKSEEEIDESEILRREQLTNKIEKGGIELISDGEKTLIVNSLARHKNNRRKASKELGISERTLYRKIKLYRIHNIE